jgi:hypothetical protein
VLPDHSIAILDTFNGAVRRYDPATHTVSTLARDLAEPSGALVVQGDLVVVESAASRLVRPVPRAELVTGEALRLARPVTDVRPGRVELVVAFEPAPGRKLDDRFGPSTQLTVTATPPELLRAGSGTGPELRRALELAEGEGVLHVTAQAASCDIAGAHPACHLARQDWGVPVRTVADGTPTLHLPLLASDG